MAAISGIFQTNKATNTNKVSNPMFLGSGNWFIAFLVRLRLLFIGLCIYFYFFIEVFGHLKVKSQKRNYQRKKIEGIMKGTVFFLNYGKTQWFTDTRK